MTEQSKKTCLVGDAAPIIVWFRRDLRLGDHPALLAAVQSGRPVIPLFIYDDLTGSRGAAHRLRLSLSIKALEAELAGFDSRLILRAGEASDVLAELVQSTGALAVYWSRLYSAEEIARDRALKEQLQAANVVCRSFNGALLFEPWSIANKQGEAFKVYSAFWRHVSQLDIAEPFPYPDKMVLPASWPVSDKLEQWHIDVDMHKAGPILAARIEAGHANAMQRLDQFVAQKANSYKEDRDFLDQDACSGLSDYLAVGEISPRQIWAASWRAGDGRGVEHFRKELVWREFAYHLLYHFPDLPSKCWRTDWESFAWRGDNEDAENWRRGQTGLPIIDAAMRELWVTGRMHNRARMLVASYLTKHLLTDWRVGLRWFENTLIDWDPASNALGWQWVAGSGPDAAPYFRVFNPLTQARKFDRIGAYEREFFAPKPKNNSGLSDCSSLAQLYFATIPSEWWDGEENCLSDQEAADKLANGRKRALAAYEDMRRER